MFFFMHHIYKKKVRLQKKSKKKSKCNDILKDYTNVKTNNLNHKQKQ